jgi:putative protein-disulfide isomerase
MAIDKRNTLITVFDPLCGWCYGFGPVLIELQKVYGSQLKFDVISGGMITGNRIGPLSNMAGFISNAYKTVEQHTAIKFGETFINKTLKEGTATFSSLEPAKVLTVYKNFHPEKVVAFSHAIQKRIYGDGIDPVQYQEYLPLFEAEGIPEKEVLPLLASKDLEQETINEFSQAQRWKINGFPACVIQQADGRAIGLSSGYLPYAELEKRIQAFLVG